MTLPSNSNLAYSSYSFSSNQDNYYLEGILKNDCKTLNKIYNKFLPSISKFVLDNNGSEDDAHDVFQDGLVVIFKKLKQEKFELTSGFHAYIYTICRFIWLRELGKKRRTEVRIDDNQPFISDIDIEDDIMRYEKQTFFREKLESLPEDSKKVMKMFFSKKSLKEIAQEMGYTIDYAKKKKHKAQKLLIKTVKTDNKFMQFFA